MTSDDLKRIFMGPTLFRLDTILSPRLVPVVYVAGLATLLLWAVTHLFDTFGRNFGDGLWGLLEIVVFGGFGVLVLRVVCEALMVYFKANEDATPRVSVAPAMLAGERREVRVDVPRAFSRRTDLALWGRWRDDRDDHEEALIPVEPIGGFPRRSS